MGTRLSLAARTVSLGTLKLLDRAPQPGYLVFFQGEQPDTFQDIPAAIPLARVGLSKPAFAAPVLGVAKVNKTTMGRGLNNGEAGWFRAYDGAGGPVLDGACGTGDVDGISLTTTQITIGIDVVVYRWTIEMPEE